MSLSLFSIGLLLLQRNNDSNTRPSLRTVLKPALEPKVVASEVIAPKVVLMYREQLLPYSETFILAQGESCVSHECLYVGLKSVAEDARWDGHDPSQKALWQKALWQKAILLPSLAGPFHPGRLASRWVYRLWGWVMPAWRRALKAYSPRLIHAHFGPDGGLAARLAAALDVPLIVTFHGYDATWRAKCDRPQLLDLLWQRANFFKALALHRRKVPFHAADRIIAVSDFIRRQLIALGCPPEKIVVHYTGIDLQRFRPVDVTFKDAAGEDGADDTTTAVTQPPPKTVLFVGRLVEKKGCALLIRAMAQLKATHPKVRLVVIGEGGERSRLEAQAAKLLDNYEFLGIQTPEQVRQWMGKACLLCAPSLTARSGDAEGLGMALLESQSMGLPVVASRSGGISEAVLDGKTGFLVDEGNVDGFAEAITRLLNDQRLCDRLAKAGRAHVEDKFDLHKNTAELEKLYEAVVQQHVKKSM